MITALIGWRWLNVDVRRYLCRVARLGSRGCLGSNRRRQASARLGSFTDGQHRQRFLTRGLTRDLASAQTCPSRRKADACPCSAAERVEAVARRSRRAGSRSLQNGMRACLRQVAGDRGRQFSSFEGHGSELGTGSRIAR